MTRGACGGKSSPESHDGALLLLLCVGDGLYDYNDNGGELRPQCHYPSNCNNAQWGPGANSRLPSESRLSLWRLAGGRVYYCLVAMETSATQSLQSALVLITSVIIKTSQLHWATLMCEYISTWRGKLSTCICVCSTRDGQGGFSYTCYILIRLKMHSLSLF